MQLWRTVAERRPKCIQELFELEPLCAACEASPEFRSWNPGDAEPPPVESGSLEFLEFANGFLNWRRRWLPGMANSGWLVNHAHLLLGFMTHKSGMRPGDRWEEALEAYEKICPIRPARIPMPPESEPFVWDPASWTTKEGAKAEFLKMQEQRFQEYALTVERESHPRLVGKFSRAHFDTFVDRAFPTTAGGNTERVGNRGNVSRMTKALAEFLSVEF